MDTTVLMNFLLLWLVIVPTPGANQLMVTHQALTRPAAHVAFAILGNVSGILLLATLAMLGWAAALETFPWLRLAVYMLGGGYLIYLGVRLLGRARITPPLAADGSARGVHEGGTVIGLLVAAEPDGASGAVRWIRGDDGILGTRDATLPDIAAVETDVHRHALLGRERGRA